jgi:DNA-binding transcriptional regulator YiaG
MSHPNRSKVNRSTASNPSTTEIRAARDRAGLDEAAAARVVYSSEKFWKECEAGEKRMHPATFELFLIKTGQSREYGSVAAAIAEEREACAQLCDPQPPLSSTDLEWLALEQAAERIRSRGE